jgi:hypothetical protein
VVIYLADVVLELPQHRGDVFAWVFRSTRAGGIAWMEDVNFGFVF